MNTTLIDTILQQLNILIAEAELNNKWLHCESQDIWLSPKELKDLNSKGKFIWGAINWSLKSPQEKLKQLNYNIAEAIKEKEAFMNRLSQF